MRRLPQADCVGLFPGPHSTVMSRVFAPWVLAETADQGALSPPCSSEPVAKLSPALLFAVVSSKRSKVPHGKVNFNYLA